jgi:hypothetical protein
MSQSSAEPAGHIDKIVALCRGLTAFVRSFESRSKALESCVFVCAYCRPEYSQYCALSQIFNSIQALKLLHAPVRRLDKNTVFKIAFHLGSACENLKSSNRLNQSELKQLTDLADAWLSGDSKSIFDDFDEDDQERLWKKAALPWLETLELVPFKNSLLRKHFDDPSYKFKWVQNVGAVIRREAKADPLFNYGCICEELVFADKTDLHFCWLPTQRDTDGAYRWAICLWGGSDLTDAIDLVRESLEARTKEAWELESGVRRLSESVGTVKDTVDAVDLLVEAFLQELTSARTKEAEVKKAEVLRLRAAFHACYEPRLLEHALSMLQTEKRAQIVEKVNVVRIIQELAGAR